MWTVTYKYWIVWTCLIGTVSIASSELQRTKRSEWFKRRNDQGPYSFSIPIFKALGFPEPRAFRNYVAGHIRRGFDFRTILLRLKDWGYSGIRLVRPLVEDSTDNLRHAVDRMAVDILGYEAKSAIETLMNIHFTNDTNNNNNDDDNNNNNIDRSTTKKQTVEEAVYVLGRSLLGPNVTDRLVPTVRKVVTGLDVVNHGLNLIGNAFHPVVEIDGSGVRIQSLENDGSKTDVSRQRNEDPRISVAPRCTTPHGTAGKCVDMQECPALLADLSLLRRSICFKSLIVPGVCCPDNGVTIFNFGTGNEVEQSTFASTTTTTTTTTTTPPPRINFENDFLNLVPGTNLECGSTKIPQSRIVGGETTYEGQYPWMAAIYLHGGGRTEFWCGGALVSRTHVLTAAHCTKDSKKKSFRSTQFTIKLGEWDLSKDETYSREYKVIEITAHPDFKANGFYNDIAVFTLEQPVEFSNYIQPICLPSGPQLEEKFIGSSPVALGWGTTHYGGSEVNQLQGVSLPVWTNQDCDNAYFQPITEVFLCAGYASGGRDACQGDSGGPLMLYHPGSKSWILVGIVSFGNRCAEPGYPGVYTRITHFMDWILQNMN